MAVVLTHKYITYIHTYVHTYLRTHTVTCIHTDIHTYIHTYTFTCIHNAYINTCIHTHTHNARSSYIKLQKVWPSMQCPFRQLAVARLRQFKLFRIRNLRRSPHLTSPPYQTHICPLWDSPTPIWTTFGYITRHKQLILLSAGLTGVSCRVLSSRTVCSKTRRNADWRNFYEHYHLKRSVK